MDGRGRRFGVWRESVWWPCFVVDTLAAALSSPSLIPWHFLVGFLFPPLGASAKPNFAMAGPKLVKKVRRVCSCIRVEILCTDRLLLHQAFLFGFFFFLLLLLLFLFKSHTAFCPARHRSEKTWGQGGFPARRDVARADNFLAHLALGSLLPPTLFPSLH